MALCLVFYSWLYKIRELHDKHQHMAGVKTAIYIMKPSMQQMKIQLGTLKKPLNSPMENHRTFQDKLFGSLKKMRYAPTPPAIL